jgi:cellulose synthase/poly-beta-1,6-N-acetylglucosamine synthase-like glycosyltransferase
LLNKPAVGGEGRANLLILMPGLVMLSIVVVIYGLYFKYVLGRKDLISSFVNSLLNFQCSADSNLSDVSIIVSTFNEAKVIDRKIENISELNYPKEKLEVIVYDDASSDGTAEIAEKALREKKLDGNVVRNLNRIGLNRSLNAAVAQAKYNLVCVTDSDVLLDKDALRKSVSALQGFRNAGGVTGHIEPVFEGKGVAQNSERSYRGFYHESMLAESALHSAFPGNGPLIVYDKTKIPSSIPKDYGSTDGNIAINVIRNGFRFIYVPNAVVFEPSPENLSQHRLQKIRRAKRLLQVFIKNRDISFDRKYGSFGRQVFPLKLLMLTLCPILLLTSFFFIGAYVALSRNTLLYSLTGTFLIGTSISLLSSKRVGSFFSSFILHQLYLVIGLFSSFRKSVYWKTIDRKTRLNLSVKK